jgi:hypothetical protein
VNEFNVIVLLHPSDYRHLGHHQNVAQRRIPEFSQQASIAQSYKNGKFLGWKTFLIDSKQEIRTPDLGSSPLLFSKQILNQQ